MGGWVVEPGPNPALKGSPQKSQLQLRVLREKDSFQSLIQVVN